MAELIALDETIAIFDQRGIGTRRFNAYIRNLTTQVNTTTSSTEEINTQLSSQQQSLSQLAELLKNQDRIVVTDIAVTARPFDTVICTNAASIDITTPINPIKGDVFNVKRTGGEVVVKGSIDGQVDMTINVQWYSAKLAYTGSEWSRI